MLIPSKLQYNNFKTYKLLQNNKAFLLSKKRIKMIEIYCVLINLKIKVEKPKQILNSKNKSR